MYIGPCIIVIVEEWETNMMSQFIKFYFTFSVLNTDTTPTSHTETPTHIETRTHNQCGDTIEKSQAPDGGWINIWNMLSTEKVK